MYMWMTYKVKRNNAIQVILNSQLVCSFISERSSSTLSTLLARVYSTLLTSPPAKYRLKTVKRADSGGWQSQIWKQRTCKEVECLNSLHSFHPSFLSINALPLLLQAFPYRPLSSLALFLYPLRYPRRDRMMAITCKVDFMDVAARLRLQRVQITMHISNYVQFGDVSCRNGRNDFSWP